MTIRAYLAVAGLTDIGYRFYTQNTPVAARQTAGILDEGEGWYSVSVTLAGDHVRWDSTGTPAAVAREDFALRSDIATLLARLTTAVSAGSGAYAVTLTVKDEADAPLENARVRLTEGANSFTALTGANGIVTLNLDPATYALAVTKPGYSFAGSICVVSGAANFDVQMTLVVIAAPADPDQATGFLVTRDGQGVPVGFVGVFFQLRAASGFDSYRVAEFEVKSAADGLLEVALLKGGRYRAKRAYGFKVNEPEPKWIEFVVPDDVGSFALPQVMGAP